MLEYYELYHTVSKELGNEGKLTQKQSTALKFYMREYLHLPLQLIADVLGIQKKHLVRDLRRIEARANRVNIPVSMQNRYAETVAQIDDVARDAGFKPRALSNMAPWQSQQALWDKALALGVGHMYDGESEVSTDIEDLVFKIRKFPSEEEAVAYIKQHYTVSNA